MFEGPIDNVSGEVREGRRREDGGRRMEGGKKETGKERGWSRTYL
jgi:hypothetical protein